MVEHRYRRRRPDQSPRATSIDQGARRCPGLRGVPLAGPRRRARRRTAPVVGFVERPAPDGTPSLNHGATPRSRHRRLRSTAARTASTEDEAFVGCRRHQRIIASRVLRHSAGLGAMGRDERCGRQRARPTGAARRHPSARPRRASTVSTCCRPCTERTTDPDHEAAPGPMALSSAVATAHHRGVESGGPGPRPLMPAECLELLAGCTVGRIAVVHEGYPVVFPVNFVLSRLDGAPVIAIRTRPGPVTPGASSSRTS